MPKVSVIMPVYNGEKFIQNAMDSILSQTFQDFELIVINDGSGDSSADIMASYDDPRIVLINNEVNTGLPNVRNQGLDTSRGEYIAWLDCDDCSVTERLEKQVKFLDENPQIGVCGAWIRIVGGIRDEIVQFPTIPEIIRSEMLFNNCLANSTVMMRAACTREIGLRFDLSHHLSQDYGLWVRIPKPWKITNIPDVLTIYHLHSDQVTVIFKQKQIDIAWEIQREQLLHLGISPTGEERVIHMSLGGFIQNTFEDPDRVYEASGYLIKLDSANKTQKIYDKKAFRKVLLEKWLVSNRPNRSTGKLMLTSYWMRFKFDTISFGLLWRVIKKAGRMLVKVLTKGN